jgi:hypothetical protein
MVAKNFRHQILGADMVAVNFQGALQLQSETEKRTGTGIRQHVSKAVKACLDGPIEDA